MPTIPAFLRPVVDWATPYLEDETSVRRLKIAGIVAVCLSCISAAFFLLWVTGAFAAIIANPLVALATLSIVLIVIIIAGSALGLYAYAHPLKLTLSDWDQWIEGIFRDGNTRAIFSESPDPEDQDDYPISYGWTERRQRWISLQTYPNAYLLEQEGEWTWVENERWEVLEEARKTQILNAVRTRRADDT